MFRILISLLVIFVAVWVLHSPGETPEQLEARKQEHARQAAQEKAKAAEEAAARNKRKEEAEARCLQSENCFMNKKLEVAQVVCPDYVERLAKNNYEWTSGFFGFKFEQWQWKDKKKGVATFFGDKIKFQNGFGAWIMHRYECDLDVKSDSVVGVRARPGRL